MHAATYFDIYKSGQDLSPEGRKRARRDYQKQFLRFLPASHDARILDFGCGCGLLLEWLKTEGYVAAEGIDSDPGQVAFATSLGVKAQLTPDSLLWLRSVEPYDTILLTDVLEHIEQGRDIELLTQLHESLKESGTLVLRVPNANASFSTRSRYIDSTHYRSYTEKSLSYDLQRTGFNDIQILADDVWQPYNLREAIAIALRGCFRCVRRLEAISEWGLSAWSIPLSLNLIAVARKQG